MPAAAVIREGQALSDITGRKESVDCNISYMLKFKASTLEKDIILFYLSFIRKSRISRKGLNSKNT